MSTQVAGRAGSIYEFIRANRGQYSVQMMRRFQTDQATASATATGSTVARPSQFRFIPVRTPSSTFPTATALRTGLSVTTGRPVR